MLRQLLLFAAVAAVALLLARLLPSHTDVARALRYCLYLVSLTAAGLFLWLVLAATVFSG